MKCKAFFSMQQKVVPGYCTCWAFIDARRAVLASLHHFQISPLILLSRKIRKVGHQSEEAAHAGYVGYIVPSVFCQAAVHSQEFLGQRSPDDVVALRLQDAAYNGFHADIGFMGIGRRNNEVVRPAFK
jgi:hypothetical protein